MGQDIHLVVERKTADGWVAIRIPGGVSVRRRKPDDATMGWPVVLERNHARFDALAGLGGEGPAPRGLPDDLSQTARFLVAQWEGDGFAHSWLPAAEFARICRETERDAERDGLASHPAEYVYLGLMKVDDIANCRVIFWFDS
jgi:hypothetical protein